MIFNKVKELKAQGLKIGITFSQFDMLHAGHIAMLSEAKNHCDYLSLDDCLHRRVFSVGTIPTGVVL